MAAAVARQLLFDVAFGVREEAGLRLLVIPGGFVWVSGFHFGAGVMRLDINVMRLKASVVLLEASISARLTDNVGIIATVAAWVALFFYQWPLLRASS